MRGKKIPEVVRDQIKELLTARSSDQLPEALKIHLDGLDPKDLEVSSRTVARVRAEAKKAGNPYRPTPEGEKHAKKLRERKEDRKKNLDQALAAFRAGEPYEKAAGDAGVSVSTLYRHCRAEGQREKDGPRKGDQVPSKKPRR